MGYVGAKPSAVPLTSADITDGIITSAKIADGTIVNADINASAAIASTKLSGVGGLTEVDMWRLTTDTSIASNAVRDGILSNWERADTYSFTKIGTGMSQSSGVFTFPSTGTYLVQWTAMAYIGSNTMRAVNVDIIYSSDNGSNYNVATNTEFNTFNSSSNTHGSATASYIFSITNTTNEKLKFGIWEQEGKSGTVQGSTSQNISFVIFTKLG